MNKLLFPALGVSGVGVVASGGYVLFKGKESTAIKQEKTFKHKYAQAILEDGSNLWNSKFESLKTEGNPMHPILVQAKTQSSSNPTGSLDLHKQGCGKIYESLISNISYLGDFQSYCAKNFKDMMPSSKSWISDANTQTGKWDPKLTAINSLDVSKKGSLDSDLNALNEKLSKVSSNAWTNDHRQSLKTWCDASQKSIFMGNDDSKFINVSLYCVEG